VTESSAAALAGAIAGALLGLTACVVLFILWWRRRTRGDLSNQFITSSEGGEVGEETLTATQESARSIVPLSTCLEQLTFDEQLTYDDEQGMLGTMGGLDFLPDMTEAMFIS
jgi:hypothetical protein